MPEVPKEPLNIEGYADFVVKQGQEKQWSNDVVWLQLSIFKEVGELVAEYEKIKSTENVTPEEAAHAIAELLEVKDPHAVSVLTHFDKEYLIVVAFANSGEVDIAGHVLRKIEKKTGYQLHRVWLGSDKDSDTDVFEVIFSKDKNPFMKLGGESSDIDYFKWQFMKKVAPELDLDKAMLDKMQDNQVNQKKTIGKDGAIVRR